jgi:transcriptional regulator with XRE-family HTH domain
MEYQEDSLRRLVEGQIEHSGYDSMRQLVKKLRREVSLSQRDLAEAAGVNRSSIAQWELGQIQLSVPDLARLMKALYVVRDEQRETLVEENVQSAVYLVRLREALGLTQAQVAKIANVRQATISRAESGESSEKGRRKIIEALKAVRDRNKGTGASLRDFADPVLLTLDDANPKPADDLTLKIRVLERTVESQNRLIKALLQQHPEVLKDAKIAELEQRVDELRDLLGLETKAALATSEAAELRSKITEDK